MARREVTGRKPGSTDSDHARSPQFAMSISEFCQAFRISEDFFFKLKRQGQAPCLMKVGSRTLISLAAADKWRIDREQATAAAAKIAAEIETA